VRHDTKRAIDFPVSKSGEAESYERVRKQREREAEGGGRGGGLTEEKWFGRGTIMLHNVYIY
jgi:hypothetical protein